MSVFLLSRDIKFGFCACYVGVRAYIASVPSPVKDVGKRTSGIKRCNKYTLQFDIQSQATHSLNSRIKQLTMDFEICDFG